MEENYDPGFWITFVVFKKLLSFVGFYFAVVFLVLWDVFSVSIVVPVCFVLGVKMFLVFLNWKICQNVRRSEKNIVIAEVVEVFFWILMIPAAIFKVQLIIAGIPLYLHTLIATLIEYKHPASFVIILHVIQILLNWAKSLTFICLALRVQNIIFWDWVYLFWPVWLVIVLTLFTSTLYILGQYVFQRQSSPGSRVPLYLFYLVLSSGIAIGSFISGVSRLKQSNDHQTFKTTCIIFLIIFFINIILMLMKRREFLQWVLTTFSIEISGDFSSQIYSQKGLKSFLSSITFTKISSTFYRRATQAEGPMSFNSIIPNSAGSSLKECNFCTSNEPDSVFLPCGHAGICNTCALKFLENGKNCHLCRQVIQQVVLLSKENDGKVVVTEVDKD